MYVSETLKDDDGDPGHPLPSTQIKYSNKNCVMRELLFVRCKTFLFPSSDEL